jgi:hypothetical protein
MQPHPDNNVKPRNEIRDLFKGPIYLLLLKLPFFLIGLIIYIVYRIVKFAVEQMIKMFAAVVIYSAYLVENIGYYLVLICRGFPTYVRYFGTTFYRKILEPVKLFMYNSILPFMYDISKWILDTISCFCIRCYQQIIQPALLLCYFYIIAPIPTWINELSIAFRIQLSLLFLRFRSACIWTWQNILYPLSIFIFIDILLPFYTNIVKIGPYIYTEFLIPLCIRVKGVVPIIQYYLQKLLLHVSTCLLCTISSFCDMCGFFYGYIVKVGPYVYTEFLIPLFRQVKGVVSIIYYYLQQLLFHVSTCIVCTIGSFCDMCGFFYGYIVKIGPYIYTEFLIPVCKQVKDVMSVLHHYLRNLLLHVSTCLVYTICSFCDTCAFFYNYILLPFYENIVKIGSYIYTEFLIPLFRQVKDVVSIIYYYLEKLLLHVSTCMACTIGSFCNDCTFFYGYILLGFDQVIFKICPFIYRELLKPVSKSVRYIARMICDSVFQFIFNTVGNGLYSIGQSCYEYLLQSWSIIVSTILPAIGNLFSEIVIAVWSGVNATALAIATLGRAVVSVFSGGPASSREVWQ